MKIIWEIAEDFVTKKRQDGRSVIARAEIQAMAISSSGLRIDPAPHPHPRHADIVDWPAQAEERLERAHLLALDAGLYLP